VPNVLVVVLLGDHVAAAELVVQVDRERRLRLLRWGLKVRRRAVVYIDMGPVGAIIGAAAANWGIISNSSPSASIGMGVGGVARGTGCGVGAAACGAVCAGGAACANIVGRIGPVLRRPPAFDDVAAPCPSVP
jgi:hypothetical protein